MVEQVSLCMHPDISECEQSVVLEEASIDPIGIRDCDDLGPVLQFGSLADKVEEETEALHGAVKGHCEGLSHGLEELLADG